MNRAPWLLLAASAAMSTLAAPAPTVVARLYFVVLLGGAVVSALGLVGRMAQLWAAALLLALALGQALAERPVAQPPSSQWTAALRTPVERLRHTIALPVGSRQWAAWWERAKGAAVYVCARGPLSTEDGLELFANGERTARITQEQAIGPRPQPTSVGFYRLPLDRARLEATTPLVLELRRGSEASARPIDVCGTFAYRPSAGIESSAFFDGVSWTNPGLTQRGRYVIELRLEEASGRTVAALY
ncbi:MAG TPA: hypothetical protein VFN74_18590 [Chloroflexota bacterium]|nr:hypothetical protein [Chloroflexota bacterium]